LKNNFRIGYGYDVHRFAAGRKLFIGGVEIPYEKGLDGHSDADILLHALCDSLLGALALGDIGKHFPNTDDKYKNIDSKELLKSVKSLIEEEGYGISNIDSTVIIEEPKLSPHIDKIREVISTILHIEKDQISVKATTSEGLGFIGEKEGAAASAVSLLFKLEN
jgi:2-C-methyl-D-erythritol 2,4-cyclodiphosphate synthase